MTREERARYVATTKEEGNKRYVVISLLTLRSL